MDSCLGIEREKKKRQRREFLCWVFSFSFFFELTGHWCAAADQKEGRREMWEGFSRETERTLSAHRHAHTSTYLHTSIQHICTWRGRDGKSFQLSVGVFVCWLQIAKRAQRLYIALNLRLSFVETSSGYLFSGVGDGEAFAWLTD